MSTGPTRRVSSGEEFYRNERFDSSIEVERGPGDPFRIDPADSHALADLLDPENYAPAEVDVDALLDVGLAYLAAERYERAIEVFARVAWFGPDTPQAAEAWVNRGVAHAQLEEYDEAVGAHREALSLDPDPGVAAVAETNLAYALWESGDSSNPLEHAERAVELDPRLAEAWYNLGYLYGERALSEAAVEALENARRLGFSSRLVDEELARARDRLEAAAPAERERDREGSVVEGSERPSAATPRGRVGSFRKRNGEPERDRFGA